MIEPAIPTEADARAVTGRDLWLALLLVVLTAVVYLPVREHGFVNYDDTKYVTANPTVQAGLTVEGLLWALDNRQTANWHPLTWLSHMLDCELFGLDPAGPHLVNVALHALAAALLLLAARLLGLGTWGATFVAALFALHPLRVESVAWVAERKDVLSGVFWMLALGAYARYVARPSWRRHALVSLALLFGLSAKPMLVSLPLVLLALDLWPLRRFDDADGGGLGERVREKLPWLALAAAAAAVTLYVQSRGGAVRSGEAIALSARLANACVATVTYVAKTLWPTDLAVFYPHPALVWPERPPWDAKAIGAALAIVAVTVLAFRTRRRLPWLAGGWGWYLIALAPVVGIVQVGEQAWADRYAYLPTVGLSLIVVGAAGELVRRRRALVAPFAVLATLVLAACTVATRAQLSVWRDSTTLFEHALAVTERNPVAWFCLGVEREAAGDADGAIEAYRESLAIQADQPRALNNLGVALQRIGRLEEARSYLEAALSLDDEYAEAYNNLGILTARQRGLDRAAALFERSLELRPDSPGTRRNLAGMHEARGRLDEALLELLEAERLAPADPAVQADLGRVLRQLGRRAEAAAHFERALEALAQSPAALPVADGLAWILATAPEDALRDGPRALRLARRCASAAPNDARVLSTLAAALAETGRFDEAADAQTRALEAAGNRLGVEERAELERRRALFESGQPLRATR